VELAVELPSEADETVTYSVHFWLIDPKDVADLDCARLVGDLADPYEPLAARALDEVVVYSEAQTVAVEDVANGSYLAYAETTDFVGKTALAGCVEVDVDGTTTTTIPLTVAGTFDCTDPATEENAPCNDGLFCTVGDRCVSGACQAGGDRDCTFLSEQCKAGTCSETDGCYTVNVDGSCNDGLFCTEGDICADGDCVGGPPPDCSVEDGECVAGYCDTIFDECRPQDDPTYECRLLLDPECNTLVACNAVTDLCEPANGNVVNVGAECNRQCWDDSVCIDNNGVGECPPGTNTVTPVVDESLLEDNCNDFEDNDCDGLIDGDDDGCVDTGN
jgi:hypothetical protein